MGPCECFHWQDYAVYLMCITFNLAEVHLKGKVGPAQTLFLCLELAWGLLWCFFGVKTNGLAPCHDLQPQEFGLRPGLAFPAVGTCKL